MPITYHLTADPSQGHKVAVRLELAGLAAEAVELVLPSWVPGSYELMEYARNLGPLAAHLPQGGAARTVVRRDKARWRIELEGSDSLEVDYWVYGHEELTEAFELTPDHFFLNAALGLPYIDGAREEAYDLVLHLPPEWSVQTELALTGRSPVRLRARDYDELVDTPVHAGRPTELQFRARGTPHDIVLCGRGSNFEPHRLQEDLRKIVETASGMFGELPYPHYTFYYHLTDFRGGGLEHATSNSCVIPRGYFRPDSEYRKFLSLSSHEFFHAYLVKRIRPAALIPFDYTREQYTRLLWLMEGTTDYYGWLVLRRAGLFSPTRSLEELSTLAGKFLLLPGRHLQSLEESSMVAWIDLYKQFENKANRSISYYDKGFLVSLLLDLELRHRSENRASLDDVLRLLWREHGRPGVGIPEDAMPGIVARATGVDVTEFFRDYVAGTVDLDLDRYARYAGLTFGPKPKVRAPDDDGEPGYLGITFDDFQGRPRIRTVFDGGPGQRGGLSPKDEIVAIDGARVSHDDLPKHLARLPVGREVDVAVFRRSWLTHLKVTPASPPPESYQFVPVADPTPLARSIYASWLGTPWEPAKAEVKDRPAPGS